MSTTQWVFFWIGASLVYLTLGGIIGKLGQKWLDYCGMDEFEDDGGLYLLASFWPIFIIIFFGTYIGKYIGLGLVWIIKLPLNAGGYVQNSIEKWKERKERLACEQRLIKEKSVVNPREVM